MSDENKQVVLSQIEALNRGDLALVEELTHPDFFNHEAVASRANGVAGMRETARKLRESFAGFRLDPLDVIAEGDRVVVRARASGRHVGEFAGIRATGREFAVQQVHIWRLAEGKVVEHWACRDDLGLLDQVGAWPPNGG